MKRAAGLLLILLLAGCATTPPLPGTRPATEISDWQLNGRIALRHGDEGWHASLWWLQQADDYQLKVSGPLGQGGFELAGDAQGVVLVDANGQTSYARDADELLQHATGWRLPVSGLRYWVRGLPAPGVEAIEVYDDVGRLSRLEQDGWLIEYRNYQLIEGAALPAKLQLARDDISVKLVISEWQLDTTGGAP